MHAKEWSYPANTEICKAGEEPTALYFIQSGQVKIKVKPNNISFEITVFLCAPLVFFSSVFGEPPLLICIHLLGQGK